MGSALTPGSWCLRAGEGSETKSSGRCQEAGSSTTLAFSVRGVVTAAQRAGVSGTLRAPPGGSHLQPRQLSRGGDPGSCICGSWRLWGSGTQAGRFPRAPDSEGLGQSREFALLTSFPGHADADAADGGPRCENRWSR